MTYYIAKDGKITACADWAFDREALETEREIVTGRDGGLYFAGEEPEPPLDELVGEYMNKIQQRLDGFARTVVEGAVMYDDIRSAVSYAQDPYANPLWRMEGDYCARMRAETWARAHEILNAFSPGDPIPNWEEIEAQLPPLDWPKGSRGYREPENG